MPRRVPIQTSVTTNPGTAASPSSNLSESELTEEQLQRWAQLIACGEAEFPSELGLEDLKELLLLIGHFRRERLVSFIARAIAQDIHRVERACEESDNAEALV